MKLLKDYTTEQLAAITETEAAELIELEVASRAIPFASKPEEVTVKGEYVQPEVVVYMVGTIEFVNEADAAAAAKAPQYKESYVSGDYYNRFVEPCDEPPSVQKVFKYSRTQAIERKAAIRDTQARKADYEEAAKAYEAYCTAVNQVKDEVWSRVYDAQREVRRVAAARAQYDRFLVLANQDKGIAERFFTDAFKGQDDLIEAVLGKYWNVKPAEDPTPAQV